MPEKTRSQWKFLLACSLKICMQKYYASIRNRTSNTVVNRVSSPQGLDYQKLITETNCSKINLRMN